MKKTIKTLFTGLGLLSIALAIYYKPLPAPNDSSLPCNETSSHELCCSYSPEEDPQTPLEVAKQVYLPFDLNNTCTYQVFHINMEQDAHYTILAKVIKKVGEKAKQIDFIIYNAYEPIVKKATNKFYITSISEPTRSENGLSITMKIEESEDANIISEPFPLIIKSPYNYITPGDNIGHDDNLSNQTSFAIEKFAAAEVGGHICTLRAY